MYVTFDRVRTLLHDKFCFHYDQIQLETKFELELGMDSREMLELIPELERGFEIVISLDEVDRIISEAQILTIRDVVQYLEEKQFQK